MNTTLTPTATALIAGVNEDWATPANAAASDDAYATVALSFLTQSSDPLRATGFDFSAIPATASVLGLAVLVEGKTAGGVLARIDWCELLSNGVVIGTRDNTNKTLTGTDAVYTYGGESSLWGGLTRADLDANFQVQIAAQSTDSETVSIDAISIVVYWARFKSHSFYNPSDSGPVITNAFWQVPGMLPMARFFCDRPENAGNLPPGTDPGDYPAAATAQGIADQTLLWLEWFRDTWAAQGISLPEIHLWLHRWGEGIPTEPGTRLPPGAVEFIPALMLDPEDTVNDPLAAVDDWVRQCAIYRAVGQADLTALTLAYATALKAHLDADPTLPALTGWAGDMEELDGLGNTLPDGVGWWTLALDDPRYSTEALLGASTLEDLWAAAETVTGAAVTVNTAQNYLHSDNRNFTTWMRNMLLASQAIGIDAALIQQFEAAGLTGLSYSNYHNQGSSKLNPTFGIKAYMRGYWGEYVDPFVDLGFTHGDIVAYPPRDQWFGSGSTIADWFTTLGLGTPTGVTQDDYEAIWQAIVLANVAAHIAENPGIPIRIWTISPGRVFALPVLGFNYATRGSWQIGILDAALGLCEAAGITCDFYCWTDDATEDAYTAWADQLNILQAGGAEVAVACSVGTASFMQAGAAVIVDPGIAVTATLDITGGTVVVGSGVNAEDVLAFTNQLGITGTWDSPTQTLTLTGTTTAANYQTALASITYDNANATVAAGTRAITFELTDSVGTVSDSRVVDIIVSNAAPVVTLTSDSLAYTLDDGYVVFDAAAAISDADDTRLVSVTLQITTGYILGEHFLTSPLSTIPVSANWNDETGTLLLTGNWPKSSYQDVLRAVQFASVGNTEGVITITVTADDGTDTGSDTRDIHIEAEARGHCTPSIISPWEDEDEEEAFGAAFI